MHHDYQHLSNDEIAELRTIYRANLADLELQAAKFGELNLPLPHMNQLRESRAAITTIDAELRRRTGGALPDPPELLEVREQIARFEQGLRDCVGDLALTARFEGQLVELHAQEVALIQRRDNYAAAIRSQASTLAADLERDTSAYHEKLRRGRESRERFIKLRRIELDPRMFRDRANERAQLLQHLENPAVRVIQIIGTGGMGKTALAGYTLLGIRDNDFATWPGSEPFRAIIYRSHKDTGLTFEQLRRDITDAFPEHAASINELQRVGGYADQVQGLLDVMGHEPLLLALDNCETMMDEDGLIRDGGIAALLDELMTPHHHWRAIVTSRREILARANRAHFIRTLTLRSGLPFKHARLFLHDLDPDDRTGLQTTPDAVLRPIVERLHGRPRLLETFVALLKESTYTPAQLLARPEVVGRITEALHDWLTFDERAILRALAVFGAPAPREALEYLLLPSCPGLELDRTLARLSANGVINAFNGLFTMHSLDAEVALRERLSGEDEVRSNELAVAALHKRAAEYFKQRELPCEQWHAIDDLAPQIARAQHLTAAGLYDAAAEVLGTIDKTHMQIWGYTSRIIALREPLEGKLTQPHLQLRQAHLLGNCYYIMGRMHEAITQYKKGCDLAQQQPDIGSEAPFLGNLGMAYYSLGDVGQAIKMYQKRLAIARKVDDWKGKGVTLGNLGCAYYFLGKVGHAIHYHEQALVISRKYDDLHGEGVALGGLGTAYSALGKLGHAISYHQKALTIGRKINDRQSQVIAIGNLGMTHYFLGKVEQAINYYEEALTISREITNRQAEGATLHNLGLAYAIVGELRRAIDYYTQSLTIARKICNRRGESNTLGNMANCYFWLGNLQEADTLFAQAQQIHHEIHHAYGESDDLIQWGKIALAQQHIPQARQQYEAALALNQPQTAGIAAWLCGVTVLLQGQREQALDYWRKSLEHCATMGEVMEYRYLASVVNVGLAALDPAEQDRGAAGVQKLHEVLDQAVLPLRAAEYLHNLRYVAQALDEAAANPFLSDSIELLEPVAAQMDLELCPQ
jgi:tetratricopeptide (TPR) repeat protein